MRHQLIALVSCTALALTSCRPRSFNAESSEEAIIAAKKRTIAAADLEYSRTLTELARRMEGVRPAGDPFSPGTAGASLNLSEGATSPQEAAAWLGRLAAQGAGAVCRALEPYSGDLEVLRHLYFFVGASGSVQAGVGYQKGIEAVWDLYNYQHGIFMYSALNAGIAVNLGVNAYSGFAVGRRPNLVAAWNGYVTTVSADFPVTGPMNVLKSLLSGSVVFFTAASLEGKRVRPDSSLMGTAVALNAGLGASIEFGALPISNPTVAVAYYKSYDSRTEAKFQFENELMSKVRLEQLGTGSTLATHTFEEAHEDFRVIQYNGDSHTRKAIGISFSLLTSLGLPILPQMVIPVAIALGVYRDFEARGEGIDCSFAN